MKHYKDFFELVNDYYEDLDAACARLDCESEVSDRYDDQDEQTRLALHLILDAIDQINDESFWNFVKSIK